MKEIGRRQRRKRTIRIFGRVLWKGGKEDKEKGRRVKKNI